MSIAETRKVAVLTTKGPNQKGSVATVATFLTEHDANVEANLGIQQGDDFTTQFLFSTSAKNLKKIKADYRQALWGFSPVLEEIVRHDTPYELNIISMEDQQGIVSEVTELLPEFGIDIVCVASCRFPAPETGTPMFMVEMTLDVPAEADVTALERKLKILEQKRNWSADLRQSQVERTAPTALAALLPRRALFSGSAAVFVKRGAQDVERN